MRVRKDYPFETDAEFRRHYRHLSEPVARIKALRARYPGYRSQREGWRRFDRSQDRFNRILQLRTDLGH